MSSNPIRSKPIIAPPFRKLSCLSIVFPSSQKTERNLEQAVTQTKPQTVPAQRRFRARDPEPRASPPPLPSPLMELLQESTPQHQHQQLEAALSREPQPSRACEAEAVRKKGRAKGGSERERATERKRRVGSTKKTKNEKTRPTFQRTTIKPIGRDALLSPSPGSICVSSTLSQKPEKLVSICSSTPNAKISTAEDGTRDENHESSSFVVIGKLDLDHDQNHLLPVRAPAAPALPGDPPRPVRGPPRRRHALRGLHRGDATPRRGPGEEARAAVQQLAQVMPRARQAGRDGV